MSFSTTSTQPVLDTFINLPNHLSLAASTKAPITTKIAAINTLTLLDDGKSCLLAKLHGPNSIGRHAVEHFIQQTFLEHHQACVHDFLPELLASIDEQGNVMAAVGINPLGRQPVFCETYLDLPCEKLMEECLGCKPQRNSIAELGNLASINPGSARKIFMLLAFYLAHKHIDWALFTGTTAVYRGLKKTGLQPHILRTADKQRLGDSQQAWGNYYQHNPAVMAVHIPSAVIALTPRFSLAFNKASAVEMI